VVGLARQPHRHRSTAPAPQHCCSIIESLWKRWKCWRRWAGSAGTSSRSTFRNEVDILERDRRRHRRSRSRKSISMLDASPFAGRRR